MARAAGHIATTTRPPEARGNAANRALFPLNPGAVGKASIEAGGGQRRVGRRGSRSSCVAR